MVMSRADVNSWVQTYGGAQLRTFDRTITVRVNAYVQATIGPFSGNGGRPTWQSYTTGANYTHRFEYVGAPNSVYNNYVDGGINTGNIIYPQDIVDTLEDLTRRTVDLIEGRMSNRSISALYCHASCHSSCHSSRGRR
jgi:hypothetical protein